jgi:hypothetical protein
MATYKEGRKDIVKLLWRSKPYLISPVFPTCSLFLDIESLSKDQGKFHREKSALEWR